MRWPLVLLAILAVPVGAAGPLLVGIVADVPGGAAGGDAFAVGSDVAADLGGFTVTDGEDTWTFPPYALPASGVVWAVGNLTDWAAHQGPQPAVEMSGGLRLGNDGDDLALRDPDGAVLDAMAYGDRDPEGVLPAASPGLMLLRDGPAGAWTDTGRAADWVTPRLHRLGESALGRPAFDVDRVTMYSSPDSSFQVLTRLVDGASARLHLHVYELRSAELVDRLVAAKQEHPGLDLQVLVDDNPVGQSSDERHATADALRRVQAAGGRAALAGNGRYDDHHLKVLVADDAVAVQSENWVPSGVPEDPSVGNRGWGAVLHDAEAADWFAAWMHADRDAWDARPFQLAAYDPAFEAPPRRTPRTGDYGPAVEPLDVEGPVRVTPLVSPDHTWDPRADPVAALLAGATSSIRAQQLDLALGAANRLGWSSDDPWTAGLAAAARRGVDVQVLAAAPFSFADDGNQPELDWLASQGVAAGVLDRPGIATLHNKAFVVDGAVVVLGSTNGNHHSRSANREVSVVLESPAAAAWAEALFRSDLDPPSKGRDWSVPGRDLHALPLAPWPTLFALLGVASALRVRR